MYIVMHHKRDRLCHQSLLREARAQPHYLVNLSRAENFRSASLSSRDYVRHKNRSLLVINYLLLLARVLSNMTTKPIKFCKYQSSILCNRLFKCGLSDMWVKRITYVSLNQWSMRILLVVVHFVVINL